MRPIRANAILMARYVPVKAVSEAELATVSADELRLVGAGQRRAADWFQGRFLACSRPALVNQRDCVAIGAADRPGVPRSPVPPIPPILLG